MLLKSGSTGDDVKQLQKQLGLTPDGGFGPGTVAAVKAWQTANGLTADGVVGDSTWAKLMGAAPASAPAAAASAPVANVGDLKLASLAGVVPNEVLAQIPDCVTKFQINTPLRLAHFLAQCAHESGGFKATQENLNYSADGLTKIFHKYFADDATAAAYARQPQKIAARIYGGRMGNGDEASGEGWKFHGRGYIQLTGKDNYSALSKAIGVDCVADPDSVATTYALLSAAWFWQTRSLNTSADKGADMTVVTEITHKVNGGTIGLDDRAARFAAIYKLLA
jgi:putative chitinase